MSRTNRSGIAGTTENKPAVLDQKGAGDGLCAARRLAQTQDDDAMFATNPDPGVPVVGNDLLLGDQPGVPGSFVAAHRYIRFVDTETDLAAIVLTVDDLDTLFIVRNASQLGEKYFSVQQVGPTIFIYAPLATLGPTMEISTSASAVEVVPEATDEIVGSAGFAPTFGRVLRFPGHDVGSPFEFQTWQYSAGTISGVPPGRARIAITADFANFDSAEWDIVLQSRIDTPFDPPTAWADLVMLSGVDLSVAGAIQIKRWPLNGFASFPVVPFNEFRLIVRHDFAGNRDVTVFRVSAIINTIGVQT